MEDPRIPGRRAAIAGAATALAGAALAANAAHAEAPPKPKPNKPPADPDRVYSPDDCFVTQVYVKSGTVRAGTSLVQLSSRAVDSELNRVTHELLQLKIRRRAVEEPRLTQAKKLQQDILGTLQAEINYSAEAAAVSNERAAASLQARDARDVPNINLLDLQAKITRQQYKVDQFALNSADLKDQLEATEKYLTAEQERLMEAQNQLLIIAPANGAFTAKCHVGFFYKQGELIGLFRSE